MSSKISALPAASALGGTEEAPCVQGGANKKFTPAQLKTFVLADALLTGITSNVQDQLDDLDLGLTNLNTDKQAKAWTTRTGGAIRFSENAVYGTLAAPITANITFDSTEARKGVKVLVIHQKNPAPTY